MLTYNTQNERLKMPEYGRYMQEMVKHCMTIEDRDERNRCARTIVSSVCNLNPALSSNDDFKKKLWDHIAIMSDFKLDIDYPYEVVQEEALHTVPENVEIPHGNIRHRHYGKYVEDMIAKTIAMPEGDERALLEVLIASHMKKAMLAVTSEGVDDERIFKDLYNMSRGTIRLSSETTHLHEFQEAIQPKTSKKKHKK